MHLEEIMQQLLAEQIRTTNAIVGLTQALTNSPKPEAPIDLDQFLETCDNVQVVADQEEIPFAPDFTHNDLKAKCLVVSREVKDSKSKAKAILAEYDAAKATDVPLDKLREAMDKLGGLK